jgi:hypothetical protein
MFRIYLIRMVALFFAMALGGCAGGPTVSMTAADRATLKTVSMQSVPKLPADMFFHGRAQSAGAVGGLIGAAIASAAGDEPKGQILSTMKAKDIDLPTILRTEFLKTASARGALSLAETPSTAQGDLALAINVYGFGQTQGFSALLFPIINVTATVKKPNGEIAWQRTEFVTPHNSENKYGYEFEQYQKDPELLRKTLTNVSNVVSTMLVDSLVAGK